MATEYPYKYRPEWLTFHNFEEGRRLKSPSMKYALVFLASFLAGVLAQEGSPNDDDTRRYVLQREVKTKNKAYCKEINYFLEDPRPNGTQFIDRRYFKHGDDKMECAPGTLFSIAADICICSTHVRSKFLFNRDRCVNITGSVQSSRYFTLAQRGEANREIWVGGYENLIRTPDNCYGSNSTVFRSVDYMSGNSLSRRDLEITVGFKIPTGTGIGREFQIFGTSPCVGDSRQGSFVITYVTAASNARPQLTVSFLVRDKTAGLDSQENTASISCSIPPSVPHPNSAALPDYFWDQTDPTNKLKLTVDMEDFSTLTLSLVNENMEVGGTPNGGFCQNNVISYPLGRRGGGMMIAERNCPSFFGKAPGNEYMCVYNVMIKRDCIEKPFQ